MKLIPSKKNNIPIFYIGSCLQSSINNYNTYLRTNISTSTSIFLIDVKHKNTIESPYDINPKSPQMEPKTPRPSNDPSQVFLINFEIKALQ